MQRNIWLYLLFTILTCVIYLYFWYYQMGMKLSVAQKRNNQTPTSSSEILYLILAIFGFSIIADMIMQDTINKIVE